MSKSRARYLSELIEPTGEVDTTYNVFTANATLVSNSRNIVNSASDLTMTLPASPDAGDRIIVSNQGTGVVTLDRNGNNILSTAEDGTLNTGTSTEIVYIDATIGWSEL